MPLPSSSISIKTWLPLWNARSCIVPTSFLPTAIRSWIGSIPWSTALRSKWTRGSPISSITVRSNSVSAPVMTRSTFLSNDFAKSRIILGNLLNTESTGTIRSFSTILCRSLLTLDICSTVSVKSLRLTSLANCSNRTLSIKSSLNKFISASKRSISTRIVLFATGGPLVGTAVGLAGADVSLDLITSGTKTGAAAAATS
ncbi:hypothetical protein D3C73_685610 [compost metagenome]